MFELVIVQGLIDPKGVYKPLVITISVSVGDFSTGLHSFFSSIMELLACLELLLEHSCHRFLGYCCSSDWTGLYS